MADRPFSDRKSLGRFIVGVVLLAGLVTASPAGAAPQILGLLATGGPVDLTCESLTQNSIRYNNTLRGVV